MSKQEVFEYCLYMTMSRFKYKDRMERLENKYEDAQHDDELLESTVGDFINAMVRLKVVEFVEPKLERP